MRTPIFVPQYLFKDVTKITLDFLRAHGIKALVLDVDNTLTGHDSQHLREDISAWLYMMKESGILLMLASNNTESRVKPFAKKLGIPFASFCCKPSPRWLSIARNKWNLPKENIALVGDQVFTDMLAGHLYGVKVLMVRPMYEDHKPTVRFKRVLEKPLIMQYYKRGGKLL